MPVALRFELIEAIVEHGLAWAEYETVDPSASFELRREGVARITVYIEQLSLLDIVTNPIPILGEDGQGWIGYEVTEYARKLAASEGELRRATAQLTGGARTEVSEAITELLEECKNTGVNKAYEDEFLKTLDEIRICFDEQCFIAAIALSGKILEVTLKEILIRCDLQWKDRATIGELIRIVREKLPDEYVDPSLQDLCEIINKSRITAVHAKERIPIPSRDQAIMIIFGMRDVVRRNLSRKE